MGLPLIKKVQTVGILNNVEYMKYVWMEIILHKSYRDENGTFF